MVPVLLLANQEKPVISLLEALFSCAPDPPETEVTTRYVARNPNPILPQRTLSLTLNLTLRRSRRMGC